MPKQILFIGTKKEPQGSYRMNAELTDRASSLSLFSKNPLPPKVIAFRQNSRSPDSKSSYFPLSSRFPSDIAKDFVLPTVTGVVKAYTLFPFKLS